MSETNGHNELPGDAPDAAPAAPAPRYRHPAAGHWRARTLLGSETHAEVALRELPADPP